MIGIVLTPVIMLLVLSGSSCERCPVISSPPISCGQKKQEFLKWLQQKRVPEAEIANESSPSSSEGENEDATSESPSQRSPSPSSWRSNKRRRLDANDTEESPAEVSHGANSDRERTRRYASNRKFADILIEKAKIGMKILKKQEKKTFNPFAIQAIVLRSQQVEMDSEELDTMLSNLEKEFMKHVRHAKGEMKPKVWVNWYYSASFRYMLYRRGLCKKDRRIGGVRLLHGILNKLVVRIGINGLAIIAAYAGRALKPLQRQADTVQSNATLYPEPPARPREIRKKSSTWSSKDCVTKNCVTNSSCLRNNTSYPFPWSGLVLSPK